jgi:hypothetical protein
MISLALFCDGEQLLVITTAIVWIKTHFKQTSVNANCYHYSTNMLLKQAMETQNEQN